MNGKLRNAQQKEVFYQRLMDLVVDYGTCLYAQGSWFNTSLEDSEKKGNEASGHLVDIMDLLQDFLWD